MPVARTDAYRAVHRENIMEMTIHWLSLAFDQLVAFLPNLIAGLVIVLIGYIVALVLAKATRSIGRRLGFDRFVARLGVRELKGARTPSYWLGSAVFFVVMVATIMQTSRVWNLGFVADGLARFIAYLPHVLAAAIVFAVALFLGNWVRDRLSPSMRAAADVGADVEPAPRTLLPSAVRGGILAVGSFMALRELQIAPEIVNSAFVLIVAAVALATALAFGLGARDTAGRIARSWYERREVVRGLRMPRTIEVPTPT
jgi:hypothetical protein